MCLHKHWTLEPLLPWMMTSSAQWAMLHGWNTAMEYLGSAVRSLTREPGPWPQLGGSGWWLVLTPWRGKLRLVWLILEFLQTTAAATLATTIAGHTRGSAVVTSIAFISVSGAFTEPFQIFKNPLQQFRFAFFDEEMMILYYRSWHVGQCKFDKVEVVFMCFFSFNLLASICK